MNSAYLVLDLQNDLIHANGPNGNGPLGEQVRERNIIENTNKVIAKARTADAPVIFVRVGFSSDYRECPYASPIFIGAREAEILQLGTWGTEIHPNLERREDDLLITKHRISPFYGTALDLHLRNRGVTRLVMSGVSTTMVVQSCVREAHDRGFACTVVADACAAHSEAETLSSLEVVSRLGRVATAAEVTFN